MLDGLDRRCANAMWRGSEARSRLVTSSSGISKKQTVELSDSDGRAGAEAERSD